MNDGDFFTLTENSAFMRVVLDAAVSVMGKYNANVEVWHILKRYVGDDAAAASRSFVLLYALQGVLVKLGCKATAEKINIGMPEHRKQVETANGFRGSTVRLTPSLVGVASPQSTGTGPSASSLRSLWSVMQDMHLRVGGVRPMQLEGAWRALVMYNTIRHGGKRYAAKKHVLGAHPALGGIGAASTVYEMLGHGRVKELEAAKAPSSGGCNSASTPWGAA